MVKNCGKDPDTVIRAIYELQEDLDTKDIGYDASSGEYLEMSKLGIIDPYQVVKLSVENSISAAANVMSVNYYVTNEPEKETK